MRITLPEYAAEEIKMRAEVGADLDDEDVALVFECWTGDAIVFEPAQANRLAWGLTTLGNACDEYAEDYRKRGHIEEARANRHASIGLGNAAARVRAMGA